MTDEVSRYKTGEVAKKGDRVSAPPTTKTGVPRIGRVIQPRYQVRYGASCGVQVEWEKDTRKYNSPKTSTLRPEVLEKIGERPGIQEASDLCHKIASILGSQHGYGDKCQLRDGRVVTLQDFATAVKIEDLVLDPEESTDATN